MVAVQRLPQRRSSSQNKVGSQSTLHLPQQRILAASRKIFCNSARIRRRRRRRRRTTTRTRRRRRTTTRTRRRTRRRKRRTRSRTRSRKRSRTRRRGRRRTPARKRSRKGRDSISGYRRTSKKPGKYLSTLICAGRSVI